MATVRLDIKTETALKRLTVRVGFIEAFSISRFIGTNYFSPPPYPFEVVFIPMNADRRAEERRRR